MHTHRMRTGGDCSLLGQAAVPLAAPSALERLEQTHAVFSRIKGSLEPFVAKMLTAANAAALPSEGVSGGGGGGEVCATFTNEINLMDFVRDVHEVYSFLTTDIGFATRAPEVRGSLVG